MSEEKLDSKNQVEEKEEELQTDQGGSHNSQTISAGNLEETETKVESKVEQSVQKEDNQEGEQNTNMEALAFFQSIQNSSLSNNQDEVQNKETNEENINENTNTQIDDELEEKQIALKNLLAHREGQIENMRENIDSIQQSLAESTLQTDNYINEIKVLSEILDKKNQQIQSELQSKEILFAKLQNLQYENERLKAQHKKITANQSSFGSFFKKLLNPLIQKDDRKSSQTSYEIETSSNIKRSSFNNQANTQVLPQFQQQQQQIQIEKLQENDQEEQKKITDSPKNKLSEEELQEQASKIFS